MLFLMTRTRAAGGANVVTVPWAPDLLTRPKRVRSGKAKYRASEQTNERTNELNLHSERLGLYNTVSKWLALLYGGTANGGAESEGATRARIKAPARSRASVGDVMRAMMCVCGLRGVGHGR